MRLKKHGKVFLNGIIVVAPAIITIWIVCQGVLWLDDNIRNLLQALGWEDPVRGIGVAIGVGGIYVVGLLARTWLLRWPVQLAESVVERIPLVKSLYSAIKDLLQFLGGAEAGSRGKPCMVNSEDGRTAMLGLITQEQPEAALAGEGDRVAVYMPMSYQIGGYTLYLPRDAVTELEDKSVEDLMKLCMTAGIGAAELQPEPFSSEQREEPAE
jgi:uncharacterized membrane protein